MNSVSIHPQMNRSQKNSIATILDTLTWIVLLAAALLILLPLVFMFTASIMDSKEIIKIGRASCRERV